ncbi:MAG: SDR family oxidoreductase [Chthoniobacterales bacterium]|nr:SDR family oxidoreductase [Chthoniobacterales bacterium]
MTERVAVITGGSGDLAGAIAAELREEGFIVHTPGRESLDVSAPESVEAFFREIARLDLLINNAAVRDDTLCATMNEQRWDNVLATDLRGTFLCAQAAAKLMAKQRNGHIANIGSFSARSGPAGQTNYAAAKAGLIGLTQSLARELGKRNVRVNCVLPGFLRTKFTAGMPGRAIEQALQMHELGRFNTVEDAARFIAFLDSLTFVSSQVFQLDSRIARWT